MVAQLPTPMLLLPLLLCSSTAYIDDEIKFSCKMTQQKSLKPSMLSLGSRIDGAGPQVNTAFLSKLAMGAALLREHHSPLSTLW